VHGGIGIGLALSKRIIEMMGGQIWVESELGKGTKVTFTCKLRKDQASAESGVDDSAQTLLHAPSIQSTVVSEQTESADISDADLSGKVILIVDDMQSNRMMMRDLLERTGAGIREARNGKEAVAIFSGEPEDIDLILMDVMMPEMDGYEATRKIRASNLPNADTIPIIALSAYIKERDVKAALGAGMNYHIGKPVESKALLTALKRHF
jgi:CheY-like chemotaxis protein